MDFLDQKRLNPLIKLFNYRTENFDFILIASAKTNK
jgi:hypothetical protein